MHGEQIHFKKVEYVNCLSSRVTNGAKFTRIVDRKIATVQASCTKKKAVCTSRLGLNLRKKPV